MKYKKFVAAAAVLAAIPAIVASAAYFSPEALGAFFGGGRTGENILEIAAEQSAVASDTALSAPDNSMTAIAVADAPAPSASVGTKAKKSVMKGDDGPPFGEMAQGFDAVPASGDVVAAENDGHAAGDAPASDASDDRGVQSSSATALPAPGSAGRPPAPLLSPSCAFPSDPSAVTTTKSVIFNEIAWMGSSSSSADEWIELKNDSGGAIDLAGWKLSDLSGRIKINFTEGDAVPSAGLFLLVHSGALDGIDTGAVVKKKYAGELSNGGDELALLDPRCAVSDYLDALNGWSGGDNKTKATLERDADDGGWHTSASPGGTPGMENSAGPPPPDYALTVSFSGAGGDAVISDPQGVACGASCSGMFPAGTTVTLTPVAGRNAVFESWSGPCYGETVCSLVVEHDTALAANFRSTLPALQDMGSAATSSAGIDAVSAAATEGSSAIASGSVLIAAVQTAGASADNDLVRLINPTGGAIDISGWKLRKRSKTGADYPLKTFPGGSGIAPGGSFIWANAGGGFAESVHADVSSSETLSADNSVALMDASGAVIDAVAWGEGSGQYGEGAPYPTDPVPGQQLVRRSPGGAPADTGDNANDFILQ